MSMPIQTATISQRDLYGLKNIDQKFAAKKWREQLKLAKATTETGEQELIRIHEPEGVETDG